MSRDTGDGKEGDDARAATAPGEGASAGASREPTVGNRAVAQAKWILASPVAAKLVSLASSVVLLRLLVPADYGLFSLVGVVLGVLALFQDFGTGRAVLSQSGDVTPLLVPAFYTCLAGGFGVYLALGVLAWPLGVFFRAPELPPLLLAGGGIAVIQAASQVHYALLVRSNSFKRLFAIGLVQSVSGAALAVALALGGFGAWALVLGQLVANALRAGLLLASHPWRPGLPRRLGQQLRETRLMRLGGALSVESVLNWGADTLLLLAVSRTLGTEALAFYNLSFDAARMPYLGIGALGSSLALSSFASLVDRPDELRRIVDKALRVTHTLSFPMAAGMAALAPWIVPLFAGSKYLPMVPILTVLALHGLVAQGGNVVYPLLLNLRRVRPLRALIVLRFLGFALAAFFVTPLGLVAVAIAHLLLMLGTTIASAALTLPRIGYRAPWLVGSVLAPAVRALAMGLAVRAVARSLGALHPLLVCAVAVPFGAALYALLVRVTDRGSFVETASVLLRGAGLKRAAEALR